MSRPTPTPDTQVHGEVLEFDFPGLRIGVAEYAEGPTGTTVFHFPDRAKASVDVRGGFPGTFNTDILTLGYEQKFLDAIVISGGSNYGLQAAAGVSHALKDDGHRSGDIQDVGSVSGAIIFDVGDRRVNQICPDAALGAAAFRAARNGIFPLGAQGAGRMTVQGMYFGMPLHSGQGGAFRQIGETKIAAFAVVNPVGVVVDRKGRIANGGQLMPAGVATIDDLLQGMPYARNNLGFVKSDTWAKRINPSNTTISCVITNRKLSYAAVQRLAYQVHTSMGRAIQPLATGWDGDVLFAATTDEVDDEAVHEMEIATIASEVMWDALLTINAPRRQSGLGQVPRDKLGNIIGTYAFDKNFSLALSGTPDELILEVTGKRGFFGHPMGAMLKAKVEGNGRFVVEGSPLRPFRDGAFLAGTNGTVEQMVVNLGSWQQTGLRV
jgi:L-aminopeptidase/D-esterase-like protein